MNTINDSYSYKTTIYLNINIINGLFQGLSLSILHWRILEILLISYHQVSTSIIYSKETDQCSGDVPVPNRRIEGKYLQMSCFEEFHFLPLLSTNPFRTMLSTIVFTAAFEGVQTNIRGFTSFSFIWIRALLISSSEFTKPFLMKIQWRKKLCCEHNLINERS